MDKNNLNIPKIEEALKGVSKPMQEIQKAMKNIPKFDARAIIVGQPQMMPRYPVIDTSQIDEFHEKMAKQKREELEREIENNESLKNLVMYNQSLVDYNLQLVNLNEGILNKINVIGSAMDTITENIKEGDLYSKESNEEQTRLLLELINIMESKDGKSNLKDFLKDLTGDVAAGLITGYLQYKLGLF